MALTRSRTR